MASSVCHSHAISPTAAPVVGEIMPESTALHNWKGLKWTITGPAAVELVFISFTVLVIVVIQVLWLLLLIIPVLLHMIQYIVGQFWAMID